MRAAGAVGVDLRGRGSMARPALSLHCGLDGYRPQRRSPSPTRLVGFSGAGTLFSLANGIEDRTSFNAREKCLL